MGVFCMSVLVAVLGVVMCAAFAVNMLLGSMLFLGVLVFVLMIAVFSVDVSVFLGDGGKAPRGGGNEKNGNFQKVFLIHGFFSKWMGESVNNESRVANGLLLADFQS